MLIILATVAAHAPGHEDESPITHLDESILNVDRRESNTFGFDMQLQLMNMINFRSVPSPLHIQEPQPTTMLSRTERFAMDYLSDLRRAMQENPRRAAIIGFWAPIVASPLLAVATHPVLIASGLNVIAGAALTMAHSVAGQNVAAHAIHAVVRPDTVSEVAAAALHAMFYVDCLAIVSLDPGFRRMSNAICDRFERLLSRVTMGMNPFTNRPLS